LRGIWGSVTVRSSSKGKRSMGVLFVTLQPQSVSIPNIQHFKAMKGMYRFILRSSWLVSTDTK
jgi:hypothetical protein